ncbi:putative F-box protein At1g47790 [Pyrus communis]|uniref:putative F-box protein At1g47790 n=1 Tax=Pyrus communis TaxID=23211 RepID=UPI0035BFD06B
MEVAEAKGDEVPKIQLLAAELPSEIIWFRILPKLPAKSLMRFKCVCKAWLALITRNPSFLIAYRNLHSNRNTSLLLLDLRHIDTKQQHIMSLQINKDGSPSTAGATHLLTLEPQEYSLPIILCTNGLACFIFIREHRIRVFNPCTRESMTLPSISNSPTSYQSTSADIKPCGVEVGYGFGFSPVRNEYMVVQVKLCRFLHQEPANFYRAVAVISIQVFTLGSAESWRCVEVEHDDLPFDHTFWHIDMRSVCLHGAIHWIHHEEKCVVVFDLEEQRFRVIPFPREVGSIRHHFWAVVDVGGCLALTYDMRRSSTSYSAASELWILKDYQNQVWVKEVFDVAYPYSCLRAIHTGEVLIKSGELSQAFLHFYDMKDQNFRCSSIVVPEWMRKKDACIRWNVLSCYDETIAPVK